MDCRLPLDNSLIPRFGTRTANLRLAEFEGEEVRPMARYYPLLMLLLLIAVAMILGGDPWGPG